MYTHSLAVSNRQRRRSVCIAIYRVYSLIAGCLLRVHVAGGWRRVTSLDGVGVSRRLPPACCSAAADVHAAAAADDDDDEDEDEAGRLVCANDAH